MRAAAGVGRGTGLSGDCGEQGDAHDRAAAAGEGRRVVGGLTVLAVCRGPSGARLTLRPCCAVPLPLPVCGGCERGGIACKGGGAEADRVAMRREVAVLRAERVQLVMAREMARRLCWEMVSEQRAIVKKTSVPTGSFSVLGICKV